MFNSRYTLDIYEAALRDDCYDAKNAQEISDLHGVCIKKVKDAIIVKRWRIEENRLFKECLAGLNGELDKLKRKM